jgi:hypothetical protein
MAANEKLHPVQFNYRQSDKGGSKPVHVLEARIPDSSHPLGGRQVGNMVWNARGIEHVLVDPDSQRQGIATAMWNEGQRLATENQRIPKPRHSPDRTNAGDAWARSVGGPLPRRRQNED